jgi:hypothetical protein
LEPLLIAVYGSAEPFGEVSEDFARGSQRLTVSRYIGMGTFDTHTMPIGKILQIPRKGFKWYDNLYSKIKYKTMEKIGLDINFNKHGAHGLELRFFDQMPTGSLKEVLENLVKIMDASLQLKEFPENPVENSIWQTCAEDSLYHGFGWKLTTEQQEILYKTFGIYHVIPKEPIFVNEFLEEFFKELDVYKGKCWKLMGPKT